MKLISFQKCLFLLSDQQGTSEWLAQISTSRLAYACFPLMNPTQDVKNWEAKYKNVWLNENKHIQICCAFYERYEHLWKIIQYQTICMYLGYFYVGNKKHNHYFWENKDQEQFWITEQISSLSPRSFFSTITKANKNN